MYKSHAILIVFMMSITFVMIESKKPEEKPDWAKKDIRDYSDADMERLLDQWEVKLIFLVFNYKPTSNVY